MHINIIYTYFILIIYINIHYNTYVSTFMKATHIYVYITIAVLKYMSTLANMSISYENIRYVTQIYLRNNNTSMRFQLFRR